MARPTIDATVIRSGDPDLSGLGDNERSIFADPSAVLVRPGDEFSREVYCILGIPVDAVSMPTVVSRIEEACDQEIPFILSTPNLNFLVNSLDDAEFRNSLLCSDLCPADGMPIVWIARLLGIPIEGRIAGADIFAALRARTNPQRPLKVYLFGSTDEVAAKAAANLNGSPQALQCVGWSCPGFGSIEDMSSDEMIAAINGSGADFLCVALGAKKGQAWLLHNHDRLTIPVRSHLGATVNFQAGTVARSPRFLQKLGFEWVWRILQEPHIAPRYWNDGLVFLKLLLFRITPLALESAREQSAQPLDVQVKISPTDVTVSLTGFATQLNIAYLTAEFRRVTASRRRTVLDFSRTMAVDARFLGLLLMLRKNLTRQGVSLELQGLSPALRRSFERHGLGYLFALPHAD